MTRATLYRPARFTAGTTALAVALLAITGLSPATADPVAGARSDRAGKTMVPSAAGAPMSPPIVLVVGDRFATALADGLEASTGIVVARTTGDGFGLTRPGFDEALGTLRQRLSRPDKPSLAAVIVGVDDHDPLPDAKGRSEPGTPGWQKTYGDRVDAITKIFRDAHVPLVWVGLPAVRSPDLSADFVRQNGIVRDHVTRDGATYVDSFDAFTDSTGRYSAIGPDADGTVTKLRRAGGLGFTHAGARKLASFLAPDIARLGRNAATASADTLANLTIERARDFDAALDVDVNAQIRREAALSAGTVAPAATPLAVAAAPQAPAAGPVLPLTAAPVSPDGQLASLAPLTTTPPAEPTTPKPGRTDDFSWPKP